MAKLPEANSDKDEDALFAAYENMIASFSDKPKLSRSNALKAAKSLLSKRPDAGTMIKTVLSFQVAVDKMETDDRALALVVGAIVEQSLETAILSHCIQITPKELFGDIQEAPVTFATKINLGYALGIYGKETKNDLNNIRMIRNVFAHTKTDIDFESFEISELCQHIGLIDRIEWVGKLGKKPKYSIDKFTKAAYQLLGYLELVPSVPPNTPLRYTDNPRYAIFS